MLSLTHLFGVKPKLRIAKSVLKKLCRKAYLDILNRLGVTHKCDRQMDGQAYQAYHIICRAAKNNTTD